MKQSPQYWKPEPRRYSFAWWALLVPAIIYSVGVIVYAHNAFVPGMAQENGHALGSLLMVLGGESGTLAAAAEVFRKHAKTEANQLDWGGLAVSLVATLGNLFVVYVSLAPEFNAPWVQPVRDYGPLVLLLCSGVDFYAALMEFGFFNASFDARYEKWLEQKHRHESKGKSGEDKAQVTVKARSQDVKSQPTIVKDDFTTEPTPELDELAMQILQLYNETPRPSKTAIAATVKVSRPTVNDRLKKLKEAGKIV